MFRSVGIALALCFSIAPIAAQEVEIGAPPKQIITLRLGQSVPIRTPRPYKDVHIIDPAIVDVLPDSDRSFYLVPKTAGLTELSVFDSQSVRMAYLTVTVDKNIEKSPDLARESFRGAVGRVRIYNHQKQLNGTTVYSCAPNGCELVKEVQSELPIFASPRRAVPIVPQEPGPPLPPGVVGF